MVKRFHRFHYFLIWDYYLKLSTHEIPIQQARVTALAKHWKKRVLVIQ